VVIKIAENLKVKITNLFVLLPFNVFFGVQEIGGDGLKRNIFRGKCVPLITAYFLWGVRILRDVQAALVQGVSVLWITELRETVNAFIPSR